MGEPYSITDVDTLVGSHLSLTDSDPSSIPSSLRISALHTIAINFRTINLTSGVVWLSIMALTSVAKRNLHSRHAHIAATGEYCTALPVVS